MNDTSNNRETLGPLDLSIKDLESFVQLHPSGNSASPGQQAVDKDPSLDLKKWLFEKRLEYARYFFDHHAKQRMSMFNFFLVFVGFVMAGYGALLKEGHAYTAAILAFAASYFTVFFLRLDRRNEELVHISEDVLESLESDVLFAGYDRYISWPRRHKTLWSAGIEGKQKFWPLGIFRRQSADQYGTVYELKEESGKVHRERVDWKFLGGDTIPGKSPFEHGTWMPRLQLAVMWMFILLGTIPLISKLSSVLSGLCGSGH